MSAGVLQNFPVFDWDEQRVRAAQLVAEDKLTTTEIAKQLGVTRQTINNWKKHPDFVKRIGEIVNRTKVFLLNASITNKQRRIAVLDERWIRMQQVIEGRAEEYAGYGKAAATGLLARQIKQIGSGKNAQQVEEFAFDAALVREMREAEKQAAIEMGEWNGQDDAVQREPQVLIVGVSVEVI